MCDGSGLWDRGAASIFSLELPGPLQRRTGECVPLEARELVGL